MPARESLLDAAGAALARRPWSRVRMVDVAAGAGFSRQTLYNEFGSKEGLARALLRRETDGYLRGVDRALAQEREPAERLAAVAAWTVGAARANALVRAALTGCWSERLPVPSRVAGSTSSVPAQRRADAGTPSSAELLGLVRDRAVAALGGRGRGGDPELALACESALRLALSYIVAPARDDDDPAELVRGAIGRWVAGR
ncbi:MULTISPECIES: TetR/AcrR family transcriptional regulator [Streptomyces]|uniref:TetR/AcrR family transcriptional regulator n=1 Tax=Streptomyces TaxID=1883 RepID=UPI001E49719A|nr:MULTISPECIES: TetR family transcriptional regulator [Streptomyces]UFQ17940.1 TetR/AcrR family transcriptional regulator [Streptomyces huasconensis]WCL87548.1 TetR family transcriptional regulator [Streptomyces sp. JCM 35825]